MYINCVMKVMKNKQESNRPEMSYTQNFAAKVKEKKREKEHTQNYVVHLDQGYIHGRENKKFFLLWLQYTNGSLSLKNTGHPCLI